MCCLLFGVCVVSCGSLFVVCRLLIVVVWVVWGVARLLFVVVASWLLCDARCECVC